MAKTVLVAPRAQAHILEIDAWWRVHRDKAPNRFHEELEEVLETVSTIPAAGSRFSHPSGDVRRMLLRVTRHHVYYVEREDHVLVVAVWGAVRGSGPNLGDL